MSDLQAVLHDKRGDAFWITINRPDTRNAINAEVIAGIRAGYAAAHADPEVRVIVLTGAGDKAFCAGADLQPGKGFAFDLARPSTDYADMLRGALARALMMAGALERALELALRYAQERAQFGRPIGTFQAIQQELARFAGETMAQRPGNSPGGAFGTGTLHLGRALRAALDDGDRAVIAPAATFEDGLMQQRVLDAARLSSANGGWAPV